jgi:hypothetical protein
MSNVLIEGKSATEVCDHVSTVRVNEAELDKNLDLLSLPFSEYWGKAAGASG